MTKILLIFMILMSPNGDKEIEDLIPKPLVKIEKFELPSDEEMKTTIARIKEERARAEEIRIRELESRKRKIILTNYMVGDSSIITASGLTVYDFYEENGFYKYKGYDVLATANTTRWNKPLYKGYCSHELYEIISYEFNGTIRQGIVLDVCGACHGMRNETLQRYDVFTTRSVVKKTISNIIE